MKGIAGKGFKVTVVGQYIGKAEHIGGGGKPIKDYKIDVNLPSMDRAMSVIKNKLLTPTLSRKYADYTAYRTYHIVGIEPLDKASAAAMKSLGVKYMGREALKEFIEENALPVDPLLYPDLFKLREAVEMARTDPSGYLKKLELRKDDLALDVEIARLNPDILADKIPEELGGPDTEAGATATIATRPPTQAQNTQSAQAPRKASNVTNDEIKKNTEDRLGGLTKEMMADGDLGPEDEANTGSDEEDIDV